MDEIQELIQKIDKTRKCMHDLIEEKSDLLDSQVIQASQMLDSVLDEYYKILKRKKNK